MRGVCRVFEDALEELGSLGGVLEVRGRADDVRNRLVIELSPT